MSDVAIISICVTVLSALLIIRLFFKTGRAFKLEGKTKFGDFGVDVGGGNSEPKPAVPMQAEGLSAVTDKVMVQGKVDLAVKPDEINVDFSVFYEFLQILQKATFESSRQLIAFIIQNNVDLENAEGFRTYVEHRIFIIIDIFNKGMLTSENSLLKSLTVEDLVDKYYAVILRLMRNAFADLYKHGRHLVKEDGSVDGKVILTVVDTLAEHLAIMEGIMVDSFYKKYVIRGGR